MAKKNGRKKAQQLVDAVNKSVVENISGSTTETALLSAEDEGQLAAGAAGADQTQQRKEGTMDITLQYKSTQKNGVSTYSSKELGGSVYFNKSLFAGQPPAEVTISAPEGAFAPPGTGRSNGRDASPERVAKAEEKLAKQQARLEKQQAQLQKQQELTERLKKAQAQA